MTIGDPSQPGACILYLYAAYNGWNAQIYDTPQGPSGPPYYYVHIGTPSSVGVESNACSLDTGASHSYTDHMVLHITMKQPGIGYNQIVADYQQYYTDGQTWWSDSVTATIGAWNSGTGPGQGAVLYSPTPGSTLSTTTTTFQWHRIPNATQYCLDIGAAVGWNDIYSQCTTNPPGSSTDPSLTVPGLPSDGSEIFLTFTTNYADSPPAISQYMEICTNTSSGGMKNLGDVYNDLVDVTFVNAGTCYDGVDCTYAYCSSSSPYVFAQATDPTRTSHSITVVATDQAQGGTNATITSSVGAFSDQATVRVRDATPQVSSITHLIGGSPTFYSGEGSVAVRILGNFFGNCGALDIQGNGNIGVTVDASPGQCGSQNITLWSPHEIRVVLNIASNASGTYTIGVNETTDAWGLNFQGNGNARSQRRGTGAFTVYPAPVITSISPNVFYQEPKGVLPNSKQITINGTNLISTLAGAQPPNITDSLGDFSFQIVSATPTQIVVKYTLDRRAMPVKHSIGVTTVPGGTSRFEVSVLPRTYVILVHGINQTGNAMANLRANLQVDFANTPGWTFDNGFSATTGAQAGIADTALSLGYYVFQNLLAQSGSRLIFVGYSMGGLLSRQLILDPGSNFRSQYNGTAPSFVGLATLGTPNLGYPYVEGVDNTYPIFDPAKVADMSGNFRVAPLPQIALSPFLSQMTTNWQAFYAGGTVGSISWLAASGRSCSNPFRLIPNAGGPFPLPFFGCRDANPYSDGVVCEDSASYVLTLGQPGSKWQDPLGVYQHTSSVPSISPILCSGLSDTQSFPELFNPPSTVRGSLYDTIVGFLGSLGSM